MPSLKIITRGKIALALISLAALAIASCSGNRGSEIRLQGAGATFPNPLYQKWLSEYGKLHPNIKIDYQSIGSDGSGTSAVFTDYLSKISAEWKEKVGAGTSPNWPVGIGGKGNEGVTGQVKQTPNTIGYVELAYAVQNNLPTAPIKNKAGNFIEPTIDAVTAAAAGSVATTPEDLRVSITDAGGATAYPISSYTYILAYKAQTDETKGKALVN